MADYTSTEPTAAPPTAKAASPTARPLAWLRTPAAFWSLCGILTLGFGAVALGRWAADGGFSLHIEGYDTLSTGRQITLWTAQAVFTAAFLAVVVRGIRQSRTAGRITFDTALSLGYLTTLWIGPLLNLHRHNLYWDAALIHTPSWGAYIPGWSSPGAAHQIEPFVTHYFAYGAGLMWLLVMDLLVRRLLLRRWPHLSRARFALGVCILAAVLEITAEALSAATGILAFPTGIPVLTLFSGQWHQLPLQNVAFTAALWVAVPYLVRHHHATHGPDSAVLRGTRQLPAPLRPVARLFAPIGLVQICLLGISLGYWLVGLLPGQVTVADLHLPYT
ncbi:spirocyclase AveC family protein [Streptomyces sp. NPDC057654]|uniref:spirocyclase AveC family protein n=1 Tax=Streptomyces sp. NPDC057654 TaxID=3346196 RepID=UPI00367C89F0